MIVGKACEKLLRNETKWQIGRGDWFCCLRINYRKWKRGNVWRNGMENERVGGGADKRRASRRESLRLMRKKETRRALLTHWQRGIFVANMQCETMATYNHTSHTNRYSSVIKNVTMMSRRKGLKAQQEKNKIAFVFICVLLKCRIMSMQLSTNEYTRGHNWVHARTQMSTCEHINEYMRAHKWVHVRT